MTGLSRAQCARLIARCRKTGRIAANRSPQHRFARRYTVEDGAALARVDQAHERLSGPATRHILRREFEVYEKLEFERLAAISNGHLYNLRASPGYRQKVESREDGAEDSVHGLHVDEADHGSGSSAHSDCLRTDGYSRVSGGKSVCGGHGLTATFRQADGLGIGLDRLVVAFADLLQDVAHLVQAPALVRGARIDGLDGRS